MPSLARIDFRPFMVSDGDPPLLEVGDAGRIAGLPVLYFADGRMWEEGSAYLADRAIRLIEDDPGNDLQSVKSAAWQLRAYLEFCEEKGLDPMTFGPRRSEKPSYLFRGRLLQQRKGIAVRDDGTRLKRLAPSTVSNRIGAVARFFMSALDDGVIPFAHPPCRITFANVQVRTAHGTARTIRVRTTDLSIRYRAAERNTVEGGLKPVSLAMRDEIIAHARKHCSIEFALMLELGFMGGPRIQTICDLKCTSLKNATLREEERLCIIPVGPKRNVATKFGVDYDVQIPTRLLDQLRDYSESTRRLLRAAKATPSNRELLFLTRFGDRYNRRGADESTSIAQDMSRLRKAVLGSLDLSSFYFHCSRATFGTSIVLAGLKSGIAIDRILHRLKTLMGHKDSKTSLRYVQFVENELTNAKIDEELCA